MTALVLSAMLVTAAPVPEEVKKAEAQFQKDIETARAKAIDYLKKQQKPDGTWEGGTLDFLVEMKGGETALAALALLEAGVPADDKAVAKAVEHLAKLEPERTYVVSLQTQVLARADAKKHAERVQKNADWLIENALGWKGTGKIEGWSYPQNKLMDASNTHFAVVALHAAAQAGAKIEVKVWEQIRDLYARTQLNDGGWTYYPERGTGSFSMTVCGVVGVAVAAKHDKNAKGPGDAFKKGMAAMIDRRGPSPKSETYRLFATAELGRVLGGTEFKAGEKSWAWYREGAEMLLKKQNNDGSWKLGDNLDRDALLSTAFALYFLGPTPKP
jgi:squalene cyclase